MQSSGSRLQLPLYFVSALLLTTVALAADVDKTLSSEAGLRGPVRQSIEQATDRAVGDLAERTRTTTSLYSPTGRLLQVRIQQPPAAMA